MSRHLWKDKTLKDADGLRYNEWTCKNCGCKKMQGTYKFARVDYERSGILFDHSPECTDMGRRNNELLD